MKRNALKIINDVKINPRYDICASEIHCIYNTYRDEGTRIVKSFCYGYALGYRACMKERENNG